MHYTRIHRSNTHQIFLNGNGEVVIADQSGATPDQTDDGPLIVMPDANVRIGYDDELGLTFRVTVLVGRDGSDSSFVLMILNDFRALLKQLPGLQITASPKFTAAHLDFQEAWVMASRAPNNQPSKV